jgi:MoaA/NifB/PqqE/SkfB family radical SAM enzyme
MWRRAINRQLHKLYDHGLGLYGFINSLVSPILALSPLVLRIRITKNCNFHCSFCFQSESLNPKEKGHLEISEWKKIIDKLPRRTILDVTGGEPFIAKNFIPLMTYFLDKGHKTSVMTNGSIYNEELLNLFVDKKLYYLMFSVEDIGDAHDNMRSAPKSYEKIIRNLKAIQDIKKKKNSKYPLIGIKTTVTDTNWKNLIDLHDECVRIGGIDHHSLNLLKQNPVRGGNEIYDNENDPVFTAGNTAYYESSARQLSQQILKLINHSKTTKLPISFKPNIPLNQLESYFSNPGSFGVKACHKINGIITMYYDGALAPCDIGIDIGNVRDFDYSLKKVWRAQKFKRYQKKLAASFPYPKVCEGCCLATHTLNPSA